VTGSRSFPFRTRDGRAGIVRVAEPGDAKACLAIVGDAVRTRPRTLAVTEDELWSPREWRRHRVGWTKMGVWLVAEVEGQVLGQLSCERSPRPPMTHTGEFGITVAAAARGQGIGRAMLVALEVWAAEVGVTRIALAVFVGNDAAHGLYRSLGYVDEGRERRIIRFPEGDVDVIRMAKLLDERVTPPATMNRAPHEGKE